MRRSGRFLLLASAFLVLTLVAAEAAACSDDRIDLKGSWGKASFKVEVADTPGERRRGLMFRKHLPTGSGMLFLYDRPERATFWMKNTHIALDLIFIGPDGAVTHIHENAKPGSLERISGGDRTVAVLEINGGLARRLGLGGDTVLRHRQFNQDRALWRCNE